MNDSHVPCLCQMKMDLQECYDKIAFIKKHWPETLLIERICNFPKDELKCAFCLTNAIIDVLSNEEYNCQNRDIIHLVYANIAIQNSLTLYECQEELAKLEEKG